MAKNVKTGKPSKEEKPSYSAADKRAYWGGYALGVNGFGPSGKEFDTLLGVCSEKSVQSLVNGVLRGLDDRRKRK